MVTLIQRFGSSLNLNVHLHLLVLDGVFALAQGRQHFHTVAAPDTQTLQVLLARIMARTLNWLVRDGLLIRDDEQPSLDVESGDVLQSSSAASVQYRGQPFTHCPTFNRLQHAVETPLPQWQEPSIHCCIRCHW